MAVHMPLLAEASNSLALALVASSEAPLLLLDGAFDLIAASASFCRAFDIEPARAAGRPFFDLGAGEWDVPQLRALLAATANGNAEADAYEMDLKRGPRRTRRIKVSARKLDYADVEHVRLIVTVSDITDARLAEKLKDDLVREKAILLQELQHRVANSLQIIASILLQSARRAPDATRPYLFDAHNRLISVAAIQQHLAAARLGEVQLRPYFTDLCGSIAASMIRDPTKLSLEATIDGSVTSADISVSLGLIATELVINALKHAFPGRREGNIVVGYRSDADHWALSVRDDGVGMPRDEASRRPGLGTSIVEALAKQLDAQIVIEDAKPGVLVTITHRAEGGATLTAAAAASSDGVSGLRPLPTAV